MAHPLLSASPTKVSRADWNKVATLVVTPQMFGAVADCTAPGVGTDDYAAIMAAYNALPEQGGVIHIPFGRYRVSQKLVFTKFVQLVGVGWGYNPGIVGATTYTIPTNYTGSVLIFDADVGGMQFLPYTDNNANATAYEYQSALNSPIRNIMLYGGGGTGITSHGVETRTVLNMDNVRIENFAGHGLKMLAYDAGANPYGSSDVGTYRSVSSRLNRLHGFYIEGNDANVNHFDTCDGALNGGAGFLSLSGLGNKFTNCHAATNNQSHASNVYAANHSVAQRNANVADWAGFSDNMAGSFVITGAVSANVLDGCYTEGGQGGKAEVTYPSLVIGGNLASSASHTATSTAVRHSSYEITNLLGVNSTGLFTVSATELRLDSSATGTAPAYIKSIGGGSYSILQMYGSNGLSFGLEILTGLGNAGYSSDEHIFRNAAQTVTFGTFTSTGLNLDGVKVYKIGGTQVVGPQGAAVADATDAATAITQLNLLLARCRTHGLIA